MYLDQAGVEEAETYFLSEDFRKSLLLCNRILSNATTRMPVPVVGGDCGRDDGSIREFLLETPLNLSIDPTRKQRQVRVQVRLLATCGEPEQEDVALIDRAAAVALQSWYEIARQVDQKKSAQGYIHLLPFFKLYTMEMDSSRNNNNMNMNIRPMPLELLVVFVRFLRTEVCGHSHEALELIVEIIFRVAGESVNFDANTCLEELFALLMVEVLPFCASQIMVVNLLKRFQQSTWVVAQSSTRQHKLKTMEHHPYSDAILTVLSFLNNTSSSMPSTWSQRGFPSKDCIGQCRRSLQKLLNLVEQQQRQKGMSPYSKKLQSAEEAPFLEDSRTSITRRLTLLEDEGAPSLAELNDTSALGPGGLLAPTPRGLGLTDTLIKVRNNMGVLIQKCRQNKKSLAFMLVMTILAWRRRRRAVSMSAAAIRIFLAPFREVIDALISPP